MCVPLINRSYACRFWLRQHRLSPTVGSQAKLQGSLQDMGLESTQATDGRDRSIQKTMIIAAEIFANIVLDRNRRRELYVWGVLWVDWWILVQWKAPYIPYCPTTCGQLHVTCQWWFLTGEPLGRSPGYKVTRKRFAELQASAAIRKVDRQAHIIWYINHQESADQCISWRSA